MFDPWCGDLYIQSSASIGAICVGYEYCLCRDRGDIPDLFLAEFGRWRPTPTMVMMGDVDFSKLHYTECPATRGENWCNCEFIQAFVTREAPTEKLRKEGMSDADVARMKETLSR